MVRSNISGSTSFRSNPLDFRGREGVLGSKIKGRSALAASEFKVKRVHAVPPCHAEFANLIPPNRWSTAITLFFIKFFAERVESLVNDGLPGPLRKVQIVMKVVQRT